MKTTLQVMLNMTFLLKWAYAHLSNKCSVVHPSFTKRNKQDCV